MKPKELPKQDVLKELFTYEPETGLLYSPRKNIRKNNRGYLAVSMLNDTYLVHRVIWAMYYGHCPIDMKIDHINGDRTDNRIVNLRLVTPEQNSRNRRLNINNKSGICGVHYDRRLNKWRAQISVNGKNKHLGLFDRKQDAALAKKRAEQELSYHNNHGQTR